LILVLDVSKSRVHPPKEDLLSVIVTLSSTQTPSLYLKNCLESLLRVWNADQPKTKWNLEVFVIWAVTHVGETPSDHFFHEDAIKLTLEAVRPLYKAKSIDISLLTAISDETTRKFETS
jgi:hypothetical protein